MRQLATPTRASHLNPAECDAGDTQKLSLPRQTITTPEGGGEAINAAVAYRNAVRPSRGKWFRDTLRKDRRCRAKLPFRLRPP